MYFLYTDICDIADNYMRSPPILLSPSSCYSLWHMASLLVRQKYKYVRFAIQILMRLVSGKY